jgi:hypothetical protein
MHPRFATIPACPLERIQSSHRVGGMEGDTSASNRLPRLFPFDPLYPLYAQGYLFWHRQGYGVPSSQGWHKHNDCIRLAKFTPTSYFLWASTRVRHLSFSTLARTSTENIHYSYNQHTIRIYVEAIASIWISGPDPWTSYPILICSFPIGFEIGAKRRVGFMGERERDLAIFTV